MAVGRLDHGVEVIGGPAVDLAPVDPGEQHRRGLAELMVICRKTQRTGVRDSYENNKFPSFQLPLCYINRQHHLHHMSNIEYTVCILYSII